MIALFFDTETTGFKSSTYTPRLVQLGAILQDTETKRVLQELNVMIRTDGFEIPEVVSQIHGITNELADNFGIALELVDQLFGAMVLKVDVVVAHNISFDIGIVMDNLPVAHEVLMDRDQFCTMREATNVIKLPPGKYHGNKHSKYKPPKLIEAYQYFFDGQSFDNAHDAMADVRACRDVYFKLMEI